MTRFHNIVKSLASLHDASDEDLMYLINYEGDLQFLFESANQVRIANYGNKVYIRGLIEISNHCTNNCLYCGIRAANKKLDRYRLNPEDIFICCETGYRLGFRTFVLQGGEDEYYSDSILCEIVSGIKQRFSDCAVTLSLGEKSRQSYQMLYDAGADRYLLRHETADDTHYATLHPRSMNPLNRKKCLFDLKSIGYQVGSGFMVGSPGQTSDHLLADLRFLQELAPHMIGIGPFIRHRDTPFADMPSGSAEMTLRMVAILRLMFPQALIPSTTALNSIALDGRERGLRSGANVVMPNLTPPIVRDLYSLYNNKLHLGAEAAESLDLLSLQVKNAGYEISFERGDAIGTKTGLN